VLLELEERLALGVAYSSISITPDCYQHAGE
jgi:hypothetical protein